MEGIDILSKTMTTDTCGWAFYIVIIGAIVLIVSFITFIIFVASECYGIANICFLGSYSKYVHYVIDRYDKSSN